jgi:hypothetical protein
MNHVRLVIKSNDMKNLICIFLLFLSSLATFGQARIVEAAKGLWKPTRVDYTTFTGLPTRVLFSPTSGVRGYISIDWEDEISDDKKLGLFSVRLTGFQITHVYNNGKWYSINQVRKCTGETIYQISQASIEFEFSIDVKGQNQSVSLGTRPFELCTGYGGANCASDKLKVEVQVPDGYTVYDNQMPFRANVIGDAQVNFINTPKISANRSNISGNCTSPDQQNQPEEEQKVKVANEQPKPQPKSGMSITESIKAKMPLYAEGYECVSLHYKENGAGCDDNTIVLRNNCKNVMVVQVALKNKQGTYIPKTTETMRPNTTKTIRIGCEGNTAKFVSVRERERPNLCSEQEWFLIGVMDRSGGSKVDLPFTYIKPKPEMKYVPGSAPDIKFPQEKEAQTVGGFEEYANEKPAQYKGSGADEFQKSGPSFKITDRLFSTTYTSPGNKTHHVLYRFSNDSWDKGKTWFRTYVWIKDLDQYDHDRDYWAIGWWTLQNGQLEITQYNEFNKVTSQPNKAVVEGLTFRMKELGSSIGPQKVNHLYEVHSLGNPPSWVPNKAIDRMQKRFPPN